MTKRRRRPATFYRMVRKANRRRKASGFEKSIHAILREEGIAFTKEKTIGRCHADILINGTMYVVECQGCYYHGCLDCQGKLTQRQLAARARDARRFWFFDTLGFSVMQIWECEFQKHPESIRKKLRKLGKR